MSNNFTLDDIRAAADKKYGATVIDLGDGEEPVELVNALRLKKEKRKELLAVQKQMSDKRDEKEKDGEVDGDEFEDMLEDLSKSITIVAKTQRQAERLLAAVDGDAAQLMSVFEMYQGETELGEASPSQD